MIEIDLTDRMYKAFGYIPSTMPQKINIRTGIEVSNMIQSDLSRVEDQRNKGYAQKNIKQYAVTTKDRTFANLTLKNGSQTFRFANGILTENIPDILAPCPMLSFKRTKNIVKTIVDGSDSEVIESFGCKSWDIIIEGILVDLDAHTYPSDKVQQLRALFEINDILEVVDNQTMEDLEIQSLYISEIENMQMVAGFNDTMQYKIKAHSIKPIEFFI